MSPVLTRMSHARCGMSHVPRAMLNLSTCWYETKMPPVQASYPARAASDGSAKTHNKGHNSALLYLPLTSFTMVLSLYTYPHNKNAYKALIAAQYVGAEIEIPSFQMGVDNKKPDFLKLNPFGKVTKFLHFSPYVSIPAWKHTILDSVGRGVNK